VGFGRLCLEAIIALRRARRKMRGRSRLWSTGERLCFQRVIARRTPEQQKAAMSTLFERIEQRNGQIERFVLHFWVRGLL